MSVTHRTARPRIVPATARSPRGLRTGMLAGLLTLAACVLLSIAAALAYCMVYPVRWDGLGKLGAVALFFPLHLLVVSLACGALGLLALRQRARLAASALGIAVVLTALMALAPSVALWRQARLLAAPASLRDYLAHAAHLNAGPPREGWSIVYGITRDGTRLELDVWSTGQPNAGPLRPAIVLVHGGAWTHGNRSMLPDWNRWLNELGYEVFDVEYRMPPPVRWRDEIGDVKSALGWVVAHAPEYHVDTERISLMGGAAGANLAMLAAYTAGDPALPASTGTRPVTVRSVINFYGPTDMALLYETSASPDFVRASLREYIGGAPEQYPERYRTLSPLHHIDASAPPTLTLLGTRDRLVSTEHATRLDQALAQVGVPHETVLLAATDHGFDANWGGFATQIARAKIEAFLERYGGHPTALSSAEHRKR